MANISIILVQECIEEINVAFFILCVVCSLFINYRSLATKKLSSSKRQVAYFCGFGIVDIFLLFSICYFAFRNCEFCASISGLSTMFTSWKNNVAQSKCDNKHILELCGRVIAVKKNELRIKKSEAAHSQHVSRLRNV